MKVVWTDEAISEVETIIEYIAIDNPDVAVTLAVRIFQFTDDILSNNPKIGRPGRTGDTREFVVHSSYIVAYKLHTAHIEILTVRHTTRLWPLGF
jgi:plasmid stabilization system protein ParE